MITREMGVVLSLSLQFAVRANSFNSTTGYIKDKSGTDLKALNGREMGFKIALPYILE